MTAHRVTGETCHRVPFRALLGFVVMTFCITWGIVGIYLAVPGWAAASFGELSGTHPLFFVATWGPALAAFFLVLFYAGPLGLSRFLRRVLFWRCPPAWVAFIAIGIPAVFMLGSALKGGSLLAPIPPEGFGGLVVVFFTMLFLGPVEEFGWRGFAQPLLQRHLAPVWAAIVIGAVWGLWHVPVFFLSTMVFAGWSFLPFFVGNVALAVLVTPILNESRGSLLWPMVFHWQLINPIWPDAQPYDTWLLVVAALIVLWWKRDSLFASTAALTAVIPRPTSNRDCQRAATR